VSSSPWRLVLACAGVLAPFAGSAALAAPPAVTPQLALAAAAAGEDEPWVLRVDAGVATIEHAGVPAARLALPEGARVSALVAGAGGWAAAATFRRPGGTDVAAWHSAGGEARALPPLPPRHGALRHDPLPLLGPRRLAGIAWLEGSTLDRLAVWSARWDGKRWRDVGVVAPAARGSQLALAGAVLTDGSWLLAWSAFDGEADELVWTRRPAAGSAAWSVPAALPGGRGVPDVTPALRVDGAGALLAWSRFDRGEYRLLLSRFANGSWSAPRWLAAPGTMLPSWQGDALLFRDARNGAWVAATVGDGRLAPMLAEAAPPGARPLLLRRAGAWRLQPAGPLAPRPD
jgi:hypothetical protein